jgi:hypothetical protein
MDVIALAEATALRDLFNSRVTKSQAAFGREHELGSASMVYQYLSARRRLSLLAGIRFASGMGVELKSFSPRLAAELEKALQILPRNQDEVNQLADYARVRCVQLQLDNQKHSYKIKTLNEIGAFIAFRHDWLNQRNYKSTQLLAVLMHEDVMKPTLDKGDLMVINTASVLPVDGNVYAFGYEGELIIRRLVRDAGSWWLYCDHPDSHRYPRKQFIEKHCYIIGQIIHRQSELI